MLDTRDRILEAALDLFSERGYAAVSTKAIAESASVNEVTIYRLFETKHGLFTEVFRTFYHKPDEALASVSPRLDLEADLAAYAATFVAFFSRNHKIVSMNIKDIRAEFPEIDSALRSQSDIMKAALEPYLGNMAAAGLFAGDPARVSSLFCDCLIALALQRVHHSGGTEGLAADAADLARCFAGGANRIR